MQKFTKLNYSELTPKKVSNFESSFTLQPLQRGFANTLGNAVRRVLLSSVSGVAPFAIKIKGAKHEFQTLPGVTEDVVQLILNIKNLKLTFEREIFESETPVEFLNVSLKPSLKGDIKAGDLIMPSGIRVVNPDQKIATVQVANALQFEFFITSGAGFVSFKKNKELLKRVESKLESKISEGQFIAIDSDFSPIDQVSFETRELNSSSPLIQEELEIKIKTNGGVKAEEALSEAARILIGHLGVLKDISNLKETPLFNEPIIVEEEASEMNLPISVLDLSVRSYNSLKRAGYQKVSELSSISYEELKNIKNLGSKSIEEIVNKLMEKNIDVMTNGGME